MPNPYTYNRGIQDAVRAIAQIADATNDPHVTEFAASAVIAVVRLERTPRRRRTKAELAAAIEKWRNGDVEA